MVPHNCKICGRPGAIQTIKGRVIQRYYCDDHWRIYCADNARERRRAAREAKGLPPRQAKPQLPAGWAHSNTPSKLRPAPNAVLLTLFIKRGLARLERGALMRETPLRYPERWEALARFYLNIGFHLIRETKTILVFERSEST